MPRYIVKFTNPVVYLSGHSRECVVSELRVNAPDEQGALFHAIRTVSGDFGVPTVELDNFVPPPPPIEAPDA